MNEVLYKDESFQIVGAAIELWKTLGFGFLESVYENALMVELRDRGLNAERQVPVEVRYKDRNVGQFYVDILVNRAIIPEPKTVDEISQIHMGQALNYLKATGHKLAIILNFSPNRMEYKRMIL
jgi:GxxExxY protein